MLVSWSGLAIQSGRDQDEPIKLKTDLVTVTARVTESSGKNLKSLNAADFRVFEDGVEQKISHFAATEEPFSVLLLLDVSGSTKPEIELMKRAAARFLDELRKSDRVGVMVFSRQISLLADIGAPRPHAEAAINFLATPAGDLEHRFNTNTGTSFYDALFEAAQNTRLRKNEGRKAIVCMSDGVDSTSKRMFRDVAPAVERSDSSVYFLELNTEEATLEGLLKPESDQDFINLSTSQLNRYFEERDPESPMRGLGRDQISQLVLRDINAGLYDIARKELRSVAERTGGRVYPVKTLDELKEVYKQIADDLRSQYSLGYYPANSSRDGNWREIRVEVKRPGAIVQARSGYWAGGHH
ncbi:MAG TPA: VWA domain-containing protein [Blastocatellia bacterium]|nr:VWA domain-containing protein [Blastocatellia bacterium]